jgi:hypothetical protein
VAVLKQQHEAARKLFRELADGGAEGRRERFQRLADVLAAHAAVEERLLYPEVALVEELEDGARDALEEHLVQKRLLADLLERDLDEAVFEAKRRVLEAEVIRHAEWEEEVLLAIAKKQLGRERLVELGEEIARTFEELMQDEPRRSVPRETDEAPALP